MADPRPSLIYWYVIGSLRRGHLEETLEGAPLLPALGEFAQVSLFFERAMASSGSSFLSVASMLSGRWPSGLGIRDCRVQVRGRGPVQAFGLDSAVPTLPALLAGQGYDTYSHPDSESPAPGDGLGRSFTHPGALPERLGEDRGCFIWHQAKGARPPLAPTSMAREALGLEGEAGPEKDPERARAFYRAALLDADRAFARALSELGESGLWERSLIVVCADRGLELFDHGGFDAPTGLYQENLAVPLMIKFPSDHKLAAEHGKRIKTRVRLMDLGPTLARLAGGEGIPGADGEDLLPLIQGREEPDRDLIGFHSALAQGGGEPTVNEALAVVRGEHKALGGFRAGESRDQKNELRPAGAEIRELYHMGSDPGEQENLAEREPELFQELMVAAAAATEPDGGRGGTGPGPGSAAKEEDKEALVEKLRSLGYI